MAIIRKHPFAVKAYFEKSVVLSYAVPLKELKKMIPECLTVDSFQDKWGFVAVAMVDTKNLRPSFFPKALGHDFFLTGYRIFVRYVNRRHKRLRGLYILKSETDKSKMLRLGNLFTNYKYDLIDINRSKDGDLHHLMSAKADFSLSYRQTHSSEDQNCILPKDSPFTNWKEARRFAGPMPFTFSYNPIDKTVMTVQGVRSAWKPKPIEVKEHYFKFLNDFNFSQIILASAFEIKNVPYQWKKGIIEPWKNEAAF